MNTSTAQLLLRLTQLRIASLAVWAIFLWYLHSHDFIVPSLVLGFWCGYFALFLLGAFRVWTQRVQRINLLLQLLAECLLLAAMLFVTGGATNPLISYYLVVLVIAAYSLPFNQALVITLLTVSNYSLLTFKHWPLQATTNSPKGLFEMHLAGMWLTFVVSAFIFVALIPALVRLSQKQRLEIQELREKQLKNEQLVGIATLAAGTAHELGTPLMTMQMLLHEQPVGEAFSAEDHAILNAQITRCRDTLQQLSKAGRSVKESQTLPANMWLKTILQRWRLSHPKAQWQQADDVIFSTIPASPLLDQALLNLLDNAAEAGNQAIQLATSVQSNFWQLDILQNDPQATVHLQQQHEFSSHKEFGLGMGLYLSNASVEQFGGSIHLQALAHGGSLCRLRLPILQF